MKRKTADERDSREEKKYKGDEPYLPKLDPTSVHAFLKKIKAKAYDDFVNAASAFDGRVPTCMYGFKGPEAKSVIAFDVDKYVRDDNTSNDEIITIDEIFHIKLQEVKDSETEGMTDKEAERIAFPKSTNALRSKEIMIYLQEANAIILYAESKMASDVLGKLNSDKDYRQVKQTRCLIGWIKLLKARAVNSSNSLELARKQIERQIEELQMGERTDSYYNLKSKFMALISDLRSIPNYVMDEKHFISVFVIKLNKKHFPNLFFEFSSGRYSEVVSLREMYSITDNIQATTVVAKEQYEDIFGFRPKPIYGRSNNQDGTKDEPRAHVMEEEQPRKINALCRYFKAGVEDSCRRRYCRYLHVSDDDAKRIQELEDKKTKIIETMLEKK